MLPFFEDQKFALSFQAQHTDAQHKGQGLSLVHPQLDPPVKLPSCHPWSLFRICTVFTLDHNLDPAVEQYLDVVSLCREEYERYAQEADEERRRVEQDRVYLQDQLQEVRTRGTGPPAGQGLPAAPTAGGKVGARPAAG